VSVTAEVARARGCRQPYIMGGMVTYRADLYGAALRRHGCAPMLPTEAEQDEVVALIEALKQLDTGPAVVARTLALARAAMDRGADAVILGCTEFGLIAGAVGAEVPALNSSELLARHAVTLARAAVGG
jgi:aspartate racemase